MKKNKTIIQTSIFPASREKIWNYRTTLKYLDKYKKLYTDEVDINADWKSNIVYVWGVLFRNFIL